METYNIKIYKQDITQLKTDAVVNAANSSLLQGGGVCGAIFRAAGPEKLRAACSKIRHCDVGSAVVTPAFDMKENKYIIHAVGPIYSSGNITEQNRLYTCYFKSLELAKANNCTSIGFPLISAGIYGYPVEEAWRIALTACRDFLQKNPKYPMEIVFVNPKDEILDIGKKVLQQGL